MRRDRFEAQKANGVIPADTPYIPSSANALTRRWESLPEPERRRQARMMATYAAMMESQDAQIGRLLQYLQRTGQLENTLIVYLGDNGPEGLDIEGPLSNPQATRWIQRTLITPACRLPPAPTRAAPPHLLLESPCGHTWREGPPRCVGPTSGWPSSCSATAT